MNVILFGATGMVGQGVLRECLLDPGVEGVLAVVRRATGQKHEKLRELVHRDLTDYSRVSGDLSGYDACFFCLGISSAGMSEADYRRVTYELRSRPRGLSSTGAPLFPVLNAVFPRQVTTTERVGRAMLHVARHGATKTVLENEDINALAPAPNRR
jgi:hypothetical protein